jgi:hypothetical protein
MGTVGVNSVAKESLNVNVPKWAHPNGQLPRVCLYCAAVRAAEQQMHASLRNNVVLGHVCMNVAWTGAVANHQYRIWLVSCLPPDKSMRS